MCVHLSDVARPVFDPGTNGAGMDQIEMVQRICPIPLNVIKLKPDLVMQREHRGDLDGPLFEEGLRSELPMNCVFA